LEVVSGYSSISKEGTLVHIENHPNGTDTRFRVKAYRKSPQDGFPLVSLSGLTDTDGDGRPDDCDAVCKALGMSSDFDDDGDGVGDLLDEYPLDPSESKDSDADGVANNADNDDDNDGVLDIDDAFPEDDSEYLDTDGDGIGNKVDDDDDGDGVVDALDSCLGNYDDSGTPGCTKT
jgi:hypothetical protein